MLSSTYHSIDHDSMVAVIEVAAVPTTIASKGTRVIALILHMLVIHHVKKFSVDLVEVYTGGLFIGEILTPRMD